MHWNGMTTLNKHSNQQQILLMYITKLQYFTKNIITRQRSLLVDVIRVEVMSRTILAIYILRTKPFIS